MIYGLRIYEAAPGKLEALHSRFRDHTLGIFQRHGIQSVGYWDEEYQGKQNLVYMLAFESQGDMEKKWESFREDPEWRKVFEETERGGALAAQVVRALTPDVEEKYPAPFYDPLVTLAWLAGTTKRVELGTTVIIVPYRHPVLLARMCANIDQISGGRFILGVGAGWAKQEFEVLGAPYEQRGPMTDDYLQALKALWSGQLVSYQGDFVEFGNVDSAPAPIRRPHPPIWVGGTSDRALRRAVRLGDGWHPTRVRVDELEGEFLPRL